MGTEVSVWTQIDDPDSIRNSYDVWYENNYPNVVFIPTYISIPDYPDLSSTYTFNCHGYAWYMCIGEIENHSLSDPKMMADSEASKYFNDGSFKECSKSEADVWWINNGAHSALSTSTTDYLQSKWDAGPLVYHYKDDSPYTLNSVKYYKRCFYRITEFFTSNQALEYCRVEFLNTHVDDYVEFNVEYEDWILINGPFSTGTGAKLDLYPQN